MKELKARNEAYGKKFSDKLNQLLPFIGMLCGDNFSLMIGITHAAAEHFALAYRMIQIDAFEKHKLEQSSMETEIP